MWVSCGAGNYYLKVEPLLAPQIMLAYPTSKITAYDVIL